MLFRSKELIKPAQVITLDDVIIPPEPLVQDIVHGNGEYISPSLIPREKYLLEVLSNLGLDGSLLQKYSGKNSPNMMRGESYNLWVINKLKKMVLVCDEEGNRTFVINGIFSHYDYIRKTKPELKNMQNVKHFIWRGVNLWKQELAELLNRFDEVEPVQNENPASNNEVKKEYKERQTREYYSPENVLHDIEAFAEAAGLKHPTQLSTRNIQSKGRPGITCNNGEPEVRGITYLYHAARALDYAKGYKEAKSMKATTLKKLKEIAGFEVKKEYTERQTREYYTKENVLHDLEAFTKTAGFNHPMQLSTSNILSVPITCSNGEPEVKGQTYLINAVRAFGYAKNPREASSMKLKMLKELKEIARFEVKKA